MTATAGAQTTTLNFNPIIWKDRAGTNHPLQNTNIELWDADSADPIPSADDGPAGPFATNAAGVVAMTTSAVDLFLGDDTLELYTQVRAEVPNVGKVVPAFGGATYSARNPIGTGFFPVTEGGTFTAAPTFSPTLSTAHKAVTILQPVQFIHNHYDNTLTGLTIPNNVEIQFNTGVPTNQPGTNRISLAHATAATGNVDSDWADIDVIFHEFGHLVAVNNNMDNRTNPAGTNFNHGFGTDNIAAQDALTGVSTATAIDWGTRLAWFEGIATEMGLMATKNGNLNGAIPGLPALDRDEIYHDFNYNNTGNTVTTTNIAFDIERRNTGGGNAGEGDEASVARIVWDLFDNDDTNSDPLAFANSDHNDRFGLGAQTIVNVMQGDGDTNDHTLIDLWDEVQSTQATTAKRKAELGELFQEYGVSAIAGVGTGGAIVDDATTNDRTPKLAWTEQNSNHSDFFKVLVYDDTFTNLITMSPVLNNMTMWDVTTPLDTGDYNWVVVANSARQATVGDVNTSYWSGAVQITIVPLPSAVWMGMALLGVAGVVGRMRTRKCAS